MCYSSDGTLVKRQGVDLFLTCGKISMMFERQGTTARFCNSQILQADSRYIEEIVHFSASIARVGYPLQRCPQSKSGEENKAA